MNFHVVSDIEEEKIIFASLWPEEHDEKREILHFAVYKNLPLINSQRIRWEKLKIERDRILVFSSISLFDHLFIDLEKKFIRRYWIYLEKKKDWTMEIKQKLGVGFVGELIELIERNAKNVGSLC